MEIAPVGLVADNERKMLCSLLVTKPNRAIVGLLSSRVVGLLVSFGKQSNYRFLP